MSAGRTPLSVHVADPSYGPGLDPTEGEHAAVDVAVERSDWGPIRPPVSEGGEIAFVDGAQQIEAWLTVTAGDDPQPLPGVAFCVAAGAVVAGPGRRAEIVGVTVHRQVLTVGEHLLRLPPVGGFAWESRAGAAREATGIARRVGQVRQGIELPLAEGLAGPGRMVVLDGPLSFLREGAGPVLGAIKSHHRTYLPDAQARTVVALGIGERTPLFAIGDDRLSWYQRLPGAGREGWAGILRGELPVGVGIVEAARLADRAAGELPRFAGRPHRDPRAPQNLAPVAGLEERLRHRMGDRRLALRAVRRAVAGAVVDAEPARVAVAPVDVDAGDPLAA